MPPETLTFDRSFAGTVGVPLDLAPGIRCLTAPNPGPYTFHGTNTWLVGTEDLALIDPGPDSPAHLDAILAAAGSSRISHILLTHWHGDHADLARALQDRTGAVIAGFPGVLEPDLVLGEGSRLAGESWAFTAHHMAGHATDHLVFSLEGRNALFVGDNLMAWSTSVVAAPDGDMGRYLATLERLSQRPEAVFYSGHGAVLHQPQKTARQHLAHRLARGASIVAELGIARLNLKALVVRLYPVLDKALTGAATASTRAHLDFLVAQGVVLEDNGLYEAAGASGRNEWKEAQHDIS